MQDIIIHLGSYGFLVRTAVAGLRGFFTTASEWQIKFMVVAVSAAFAYLGVDPMGALKLDAVTGILRPVVNIALLAGAAMTEHDILDFISKLKDAARKAAEQ